MCTVPRRMIFCSSLMTLAPGIFRKLLSIPFLIIGTASVRIPHILVGSMQLPYCASLDNQFFHVRNRQIWYALLVFTKSVDSNFHAFWLAPVTRNILGYSLSGERQEKWCVVSRKFQKKKIKTAFFYPPGPSCSKPD